MKELILSLASLVVVTSLSAAPKPDSVQWPNGAKAAVCLTYDDSLASQIDIAYPQLQAAGLKGTFFLQANGGTMESRVNDWRQIAASGHELASHSLFHPCRKNGPGRDWVSEERNLDHYTIDRVRSELEMTNTLLHAIDGKSTRTFAYPCGDTVADNGSQSLFPVVEDLYTASRGVSDYLPSMKDFKFNNTPGFDPSDKDISVTIAYLENCYKKGTVAIFLNHGVGGDYLVTDEQLHQEILDYLVANQDHFWIDTFQNVTTHIHTEFTRLDWPTK